MGKWGASLINVRFFIRPGKSVIKANGCSFSFSAKEKEPKRKLSGGAIACGWGCA
jgi:hypothetical protein